ncbi:TadE/TadG family type IV pilus assembly protein [Planctopirus limnophila]|uniref:TadE/TadG family type IV pilus assembly protein n=1 Tax=Planctopirus limnophila TaxID=120 RepID=UPI0001A2FFFB|nr:TadE/TadG family type IV pilus assembly protein [Planctopirus limnophila]
MRLSRPRSRQIPQPARRGAAAVEMALVLPVLILVVFGTIAVSQIIHFRKGVVAATAEGIRIASRRDVSSTEVTTLVRQILTGRRISQATITITPTEISNLRPGELIEIQVRANYTALGVEPLGWTVPTEIVYRGAVLRE